jgi:hypothetical protein
MEKPEVSYILTETTRGVILKYMYTRPYQEVAPAIAVLMQLPKLDPKINPNFVREDSKSKNEKG